VGRVTVHAHPGARSHIVWVLYRHAPEVPVQVGVAVENVQPGWAAQLTLSKCEPHDEAVPEQAAGFVDQVHLGWLLQVSAVVRRGHAVPPPLHEPVGLAGQAPPGRAEQPLASR
jgi:hypothetical protein